MSVNDDIKELKRTVIVSCDLANRAVLKSHALEAVERIRVHLSDQEAYALACLRNVGIDTQCGACMSQAFTGSTDMCHTCTRIDPIVTFETYQQAKPE